MICSHRRRRGVYEYVYTAATLLGSPVSFQHMICALLDADRGQLSDNKQYKVQH